ncbi:nitric-oxide reductase large subunit [Arsenicicoccus sp. oral taxon 190]|uniref:nitric-oxide reductase large subunit n=1 Tax=Arsenicicoccus sp. oral taxon 190 TaxID=1658671 RepID=UPI00067A3AAC|nr:nitric-oxide reductase large subunit [Arsenicicoccus sp. oral taxon 190]AKT50410.1 nitric oxide reductase large subunit [Arsenicicoccus sp. oral taxon 190]
MSLKEPRTTGATVERGHVSRRDKRWWIALICVVLGSFGVLLWMGKQIDTNKPPIPAHVVAADGRELFTGDDIIHGQQVWQSLGGQEIGSVWGHGAYVAPDWTADWLHREATTLLDQWARQEGGTTYDKATVERQGALQARLKQELRTNTYDARTGTVTLSGARAHVFDTNAAHYTAMFAGGHVHYAIPKGTLTDAADAKDMMAFFWWTSWSASTDAPGKTVTYTQNWPHEPLIDNVPPADNVLWSIVSFILLLAGIAGMVWYHQAHDAEDRDEDHVRSIPSKDPLLGYRATPSQRATLKYFFVVGLLFMLQIACGIIGAHYGVEGGALFGIPIDQVLPYAVVRTWHTQLGIFWIATAWLATGLYVAPAVGGREPRLQRLGVNVLFGALLVVVLGSMAGEWLSIMGKMGHGNALNFWLGTQGYEYVDLGRAFQIGLFVGLFLWFALMWRGLAPALRRAKATGAGLDPSAEAPLASGTQRSLTAMLLMSCLAIAGFYGAAFGVGHSTHLSIAEYWRWWVVHLWVEGFFEVFATTVIAFLFARLGLIRAATATTSVVSSTTIFLAGGIIGTAHHLYFTGSPSPVLALGAVFSALEVVPLALVGFEAFRNLRLLRVREWVAGYKWAIYFFVSVSFWNMLGAGVFGFLINPPISLFYVQGLNLTPLHGHTALFGVYGMLGIGLMLFCIRSLMPGREWNDRPIKWGFWLLNGGLLAMAVISLLPLGLAQAWASVQHGLWYARSEEFLYTPVLTVVRWLRVPGDVIFSLGALAIGVFMVGLLTGHSLRGRADDVEAGEVLSADKEPALHE